MTLARPPLTPTASRKVFMLVMRMTPATAVPRMRAGRARTTKAANGAAIMPPRRSAPTTDHGICAKLSARRNPKLAATATTNSLVSTVPTTLRGFMRPEESRVGVEIGPQPPPPAASRKPAIKPRGARKPLAMGLSTTGLSLLLNEKRARIYTPRANRKMATTGATNSSATVATQVTATAPRNAPMPPGTAIHTILDQSTLPKRQCEIPDTAQVPISAMCTLADASAGEIPAANNSVVEGDTCTRVWDHNILLNSRFFFAKPLTLISPCSTVPQCLQT